jgi:hypothetical protein
MVNTEPTARPSAPTMVAVRFHAAGRQIVVSLSNGVTLALPEALVPGLDRLDDDGRAEVAISDDGHVLVWPRGPVYLSYLRLLTDCLGARAAITRLGPKRRERET